jgi:hypothetical protein
MTFFGRSSRIPPSRETTGFERMIFIVTPIYSIAIIQQQVSDRCLFIVGKYTNRLPRNVIASVMQLTQISFSPEIAVKGICATYQKPSL